MRLDLKGLCLLTTLFCILGSLQIAKAQGSMNLDSYVNSAWRSKSMALREQNLIQFGEAGVTNPIEGMQLKISKTQTVDDDKQLALRIKPRGLTEYSILRSLSRQSMRLEKISYDVQLADGLRDRYMTYIELISSLEKRKVIQELITIEKREVSMLAAAATRSPVASAKDLMKANDAVQLTEDKLTELESQISILVLKMKSLDSTLAFNTEKISNTSYRPLPTPLELENLAKKTSSLKELHQSESPLQVKLQKEKAEQAKNAISYERARTEKFFDYFEIKVAEDRKERVYGFEIGLNIPGFSASSYEDREKSRRLIEYDLDAQNADTTQNLLIAASTMSLKKSIQIWKASVANDNPILQMRLKKLARSQDPLLATSIEKDELSKLLRRHEMTEEALKNYILFLSASDLFAYHPRVNFLSTELNELKQ